QLSVIGLGFRMSLTEAVEVGKSGLLMTIGAISGTLLLGYIIGRLFKIEKKISHLISSGTAICGGSAIAAISPVIRANKKEISIALGTIFVLNSLALIIFPMIGKGLSLSQTQFGVWAAIAIHDTSSVIGAASAYGDKALEIATTMKLGRALWIIPIVVVESLVFKNNISKSAFPFFILLFIGAMVLNTLTTSYEPLFASIFLWSKKGLVLTLFLIGSSLSAQSLKQGGIRPFFQGALLWIIVSSFSLGLIYAFMK
ncbi:MAG: putative sulfate exporter family transporter, partial [Flavobacteriales bacterium]|nr:putative sulfate exporter family transporter [Flavobacteriales bacterium]